MTGGPGLDREDSSSNRRWRATPGRWKRAFAGIIISRRCPGRAVIWDITPFNICQHIVTYD